MGEGFCVNTMTGASFAIDEKHPYDFGDGKPVTWWDLRPTTVVVPYQSWVKIKQYVIQSCRLANCDAAVSSWDRSVSTVDGAVSSKR